MVCVSVLIPILNVRVVKFWKISDRTVAMYTIDEEHALCL